MDRWDEKSGRQGLELSSGIGRQHRDPESQVKQDGNCCADPCSADGPPISQPPVPLSQEEMKNICSSPEILLCQVMDKTS